jgi:ligand-binding sensor domain-containing protein
MTSNGGTSWSEYSLPAYTTLTYLAVSNNDPQRLWAAFSGYTSGSKVYQSTNGGQSWTNISGTLPNVPINTIVYQNNYNNRLYVGTDIGVMYRDDNSSDWVDFSTNLPNVVVTELEIQYSSGKLRAATFGRGLWEAEIPTTSLSDPTLASPSNSATDVAINPTLTWNAVSGATSYTTQYSTSSSFATYT